MSRITEYKRILLSGFPFEAFTTDIWLLCISNVIGAFGEGLYFWIFPLYVRSLQADFIQLGTVYSVLYGAAALSPLLGGVLADRFDRKRILIAAWTPWIFAPLIYSFAGNWQQLIPGAACWGISMIGLPALNAYVITSSGSKERLASVLSFVWAAYSFSYIFAPAIGSYLAVIIGMRWVLRLSTVLAAAATIVFFFLHSQHPSRNVTEIQVNTVGSSERKRYLRKMLIWSIFFMVAEFFIYIARPYLPPFLSEQAGFNEIYVGVFGSINFAGATFITIAMGHLGDRWNETGAISFCLVLFLGATVPLLMFRESVSLMMVAFLFGGSAAIPPLINAVVGKIAPRNEQGLWISIPQTLGLLAAFAAPYLGGYFYTQSPYYTFIASISAVPLLMAWALFRLKT